MRARDASLREAVWGVSRAYEGYWWKVGRRAAPEPPLLPRGNVFCGRGLEPPLGQSDARGLCVRAARELPAPDDPAAPRRPRHLTLLVHAQRPGARRWRAVERFRDGITPRRFEGRWGLFKKPEKGSEIGFGDWLRQKRVIHAGHRNERLWSVTSELYTKTLAGAVQCINQIVAARLPRTRPTHWLICVQVLWWTKIYNSPSSTSKPRRSG